jgi:LysM repeat protein
VPASTEQSQKAYLMTEGNVQIPCMFNPSELHISRSNSWSGGTRRGQDAPELEFDGGEAGTMDLDLMFDTTSAGLPVTNYTNKVLDLMKIDTTLAGYDASKNNGRPPWVKFHWGDMHSFKAIIESVDIRFTYFSSTGMPLRAKVEMSLKQYEPDANWGPQNPTSGTPQPHRVHRVQKGETLDRISARHYGDSTKWRLIAEANGITDPLALRPGAFLNIPKQQV